MNALVIFDSKFGNTERIARSISAALREPFQVRVLSVADASVIPADVDLLIIGGPTHAHGLSQPMKAFIASLPPDSLRGRAVATFDTRYRKPRWLTGSAAGTLARRLQSSGARLVVNPESFFVKASEGPLEDGEVDRAIAWGRQLAIVAAPVAQPLLGAHDALPVAH